VGVGKSEDYARFRELEACYSLTSPRWGEVERSEGEGVQVSPDKA
jgi:hypothetical protein